MDTSWWGELTSFEKTFWLIAIPATVAFIIQTIITFVGGDFDSDMDIDSEFDGDTGVGFQFFTIKNLIAFFTFFGWTGIACYDLGFSKPMCVILAIIAGASMMFVMAAIFYYANRLTEDGSLNLKNAVGAEGEVYLTIPGSKGGFGKIQIQVQGALRELEASTSDVQDILTGSIVKVVSVSTNNMLTVTKQ